MGGQKLKCRGTRRTKRPSREKGKQQKGSRKQAYVDHARKSPAQNCVVPGKKKKMTNGRKGCIQTSNAHRKKKRQPLGNEQRKNQWGGVKKRKPVDGTTDFSVDEGNSRQKGESHIRKIKKGVTQVKDSLYS